MTKSFAPNPLQNWVDSSERFGSLLCSLSMSFRQKDEDENESEDTNRSINEEWHCRSTHFVNLLKGLGDDKPPEIGGHIWDGMSPSLWSDGQNLCGHHPSQRTHANVEGHCEDNQNGNGQPTHIVHIDRIVMTSFEYVEVNTKSQLRHSHSEFGDE